ncbi:MAG: galactokinase [Ruminococcaceae bacterium]|nr:galactokinase [Oscillospiraceae bacterium]
MNIYEHLKNGGYDTALTTLYGAEALESARIRWLSATEEFFRLFGESKDIRLCSASGRTELSGNHTDHNHGRVLAAGVQLDTIAVVAPRKDSTVRVHSEGYAPLTLDITDLAARDDETGTSAALIRGTAARLNELGGTLGGFDAYITSEVPEGSGLSSSAAYEVLIGTILNALFNQNRFTPVELALAAQYAENVYFGKPCGVLDQMTSAVGGAVAMDFADPAHPVIRRIDIDFGQYDRVLCVVNTGGNHADLTDDYAAVTAEMKAISREMGVGFLRETTYDAVLARSAALRQTCGDRALLRAFHFFAEDRRADDMAKALENGDIAGYERMMRASGNSSFRFLQNLYSNKAVDCQGLSLGICVGEQVLGESGAVRVHGGGFAGTVQALLPKTSLPAFRKAMETVFGVGCCHVLRIRPVGGICLDDINE